MFGAGQYAMRMWVKPDQLGKLGITVTDIISAIQAQNTVNPAGTSGWRARPQRPGVHLLGSSRKADLFRRRSSDRSWFARRRMAASVRVQGRRADRTRLAGLLDGGPVERQAGRDHRRLPIAGLERSGSGRTASSKLIAEMKQRFPQDMDYVVSLDTTKRGDVRDQGDRRDSADRDCAGDHGGLHFPAKLARHADPDVGGASVLDRHIHLFPVVRLFDQHAFSLWAGAGHRIGGG